IPLFKKIFFPHVTVWWFFIFTLESILSEKWFFLVAVFCSEIARIYGASPQAIAKWVCQLNKGEVNIEALWYMIPFFTIAYKTSLPVIQPTFFYGNRYSSYSGYSVYREG